MTAKILLARDQSNAGYLIRIHLDTSKLLADGATPDPAYVGQWQFAKWDGTTGGNLAGYKAQLVAEVKLLGADRLAQINAAQAAGVALPAEGTTF